MTNQEPITFMVGGIEYGPKQLAQLRNALIRKADVEAKSNLLESILIAHAVGVLLSLGEHVWQDDWKEAVRDAARDFQGH